MSVVIVANLNLPSIGAGSVYIEDQYNLGNRTGPSDPTAPVNTVPPAVTGDPYPGSTLTGTLGTWTGTSTIRKARQWYRKPDGGEYAPIVGAKAATYVIPADEADLSTFKLVVTADNAAAGVVSADSNEILSYTALSVVVTAIPDDDADGVYALAATVLGGYGAKTYLWELTDGTGVITDEDTLADAELTVEDTDSYTVKLTVTDDSGSANDTEDFAFTAPAPPALDFQWTNGAHDGQYSNGLNWGGGNYPTNADPVIMGGYSNADCDTQTNLKRALSFDFTGYTGNIGNNTSDFVLQPTGGNVVLDSGFTVDGVLHVRFEQDGTLQANGFPFGIALEMDPPFVGKTATILDTVIIRALEVSGTNILAMGANTFDFQYDDGAYVYDSAVITFSAGAKWLLSCANPVEIECDSGTTAPPIEIPTGGGGLISDGIKCQSFLQNDGDSTGDVETVGNFVVNVGTISGMTNIVGGATCTAASGVTVTGCDFSGGTPLTCAVGAIDGGGNDAGSVIFLTPATFNNIFVGAGSPHLSYSNGDLDVTVVTGVPSSNITAVSTNVPTSGLWYGEIEAISGTPAPSLTGLIRSDLISIPANVAEPGAAGMDNSIGYYHPDGAFGDIFINDGGVNSYPSAAAGANTFVAGDRVGIFRNLNTGKMMFYNIPVATGIATPVDSTDYDIPGWSAGQGYAMGVGSFNSSYVMRLNATSGTISAAGAAVALARGATVG